MIIEVHQSLSVCLSLLQLVSAWSPTDSYAPGEVDCPAYLEDKKYDSDDHKGFTRAANGISEAEQNWMASRDEITLENLKWYLQVSNMTDFNTDDYLKNITDNNATHIPRIGLVFSGGGYRAMLNAAGEISGLDNRTRGCTEHGLPILQAASYISGLSGGSWFLSTLLFNNWTSVQDIVDQNGKDDAIWDLEHSIISPGGIDLIKSISVWNDIGDDLDDKKDAGFQISLTDPWGRALSHQFFPTLSDYGASMTFTSLRDFPAFSNHEMPFPIVVAQGRAPGTVVLNLNSTLFEINAYELGSWDPSLYAFADLKYIGTNVTNGFPNNDGKCIAGLDNTGFIFGTSSTLFNEGLLELNTTSLPSVVQDLISDFLENVSKEDNDIAEYYPNPFYKTEWADVDSIVEDTSLYLVDGGEDLENIPLVPLIQSEREVDFIMAYDNSMDTLQGWPNGVSIQSQLSSVVILPI
ncbi:unnamed protein product [Ambrosiozyma monospora]|uniref:Lysophospholipase n=1 Tax=Ambrosiozyma monospora TaxID=43982 RepID=A0A9W7DK80_AMBMO|nr:unnamed protein product [Ambrosiozyma monospora]